MLDKNRDKVIYSDPIKPKKEIKTMKNTILSFATGYMIFDTIKECISNPEDVVYYILFAMCWLSFLFFVFK